MMVKCVWGVGGWGAGTGNNTDFCVVREGFSQKVNFKLRPEGYFRILLQGHQIGRLVYWAAKTFLALENK